MTGTTIAKNDPHGPLSGWAWDNGQPHIRIHGLDGETQRINNREQTTVYLSTDLDGLNPVPSIIFLGAPYKTKG